MNDTLSTSVDTSQHHHPPSAAVTVAHTRRVTLVDRVALHVGLALITWSRRPRTASPRESVDLHARNQCALERAERERNWALGIYLSQPRR